MWGALPGGRAARLGGDQAWTQWQAHAGEVYALAACGPRGLLLTLGAEAEGAPGLVLKAWDAERVHPRHGPAALGSVRPLQQAGVESGDARGEAGAGAGEGEGGAMAVLACAPAGEGSGPGGVVCAVGLSDGLVVALRGDLRQRSPQCQVDLVGPMEGGGAVESLVLRSDPADPECGLLLFVCTAARTACWLLPSTQGAGAPVGDAAKPRRLFVDDEGALRGRVCPAPSRGLLACARPQAVYFYGREGRGHCVAIEGPKSAACFHRGFLAVAGDRAPGGAAAGAPGLLTLYDLGNRLVVGSLPLHGEVVALVSEHERLYVLMKDWSRSLVLLEKTPTAQLELLLQRNLFEVALKLAAGAEEPGAGGFAASGAAAVADVRVRYGDHLHRKQDYTGAMEQYLHTLGHLEPSYVIRKFLDAQQIPNLAQYLEGLHVEGLAAADHTALLLICYAKMQDVAKLDAFLTQMQQEHERGGGGEILFDAQTAIQVCRSVLYHEHALYIAQHTGEDAWCLRILLDDFKRYDDVLKFLVETPRDGAIKLLKRHGKTLLEHRPKETHALMLNLCSQLEADPAHKGSLHVWTAVQDFMNAFNSSEDPAALKNFLEDIMDVLQKNTVVVAKASNALLELYMEAEASHGPRLLAEGGSSSEGAGLGAGPGSLAAGAGGEETDRTLALMKKSWTGTDKPAFDINHALIQCQINQHYPGLALLYSRLPQKLRESLHTHISYGDYRGLVRAAIEDLDAATGVDVSIWAEVLEYLGAQEDDCRAEINLVLEHIESHHLMPPALLLKMLFRSTGLTLEAVKDFVAGVLRKESAAIEEDRRAFQQCQASAAHMQKELDELSCKAVVFQNNTCALCSAPLELPAVHCLCMHSFHARCMGEGDSCPLCAQQHQAILGIQTPAAVKTSEQDKFFSQLKHSVDGFSVVTQYTGRGWLHSARTEM